MHESFPPQQNAEWPSDLEGIAKLFKNRLDAFVQEKSEGLFGGMIRDEVQEILLKMIKRKGLEDLVTDDFFEGALDYEEENNRVYFNGMEGDKKGKILLMGIPILEYGMNLDGYNGAIDAWHDENLKQALKKFVHEKL